MALVDHLAGLGVLERRSQRLRRFDLARRQAVRSVRALARELRVVEMALQRILDDAVLDAVERVARVEHGRRGSSGSLAGGMHARRRVRLMRWLTATRNACMRMPSPGRCAGDDPVEVVGVALRFGDAPDVRRSSSR